MPYIPNIRELALEIADQLDAKGNCAVDHATSCKMGRRPLCRVCCSNYWEERMRRAMAIEKFLGESL